MRLKEVAESFLDFYLSGNKFFFVDSYPSVDRPSICSSGTSLEVWIRSQIDYLASG